MTPRWIIGPLLLLAACSSGQYFDPASGEITFTPNRPAPLPPAVPAPPYTGSDPYVLQAASTYVTGMDLHQKFILRTCAGVNGVCHNTKEYPDMHTLATFTETIGAPCNVQPGNWATAFDRCEQPGDEFRLNGSTPIETGWVEYVPGPYVDYASQGSTPDGGSAGFHIHLHDPFPGTDTTVWGTGQWIRRMIDQNGVTHEFVLVGYQSNYWVLNDRRDLFAVVQDYQTSDLQTVLDARIQQGDLNRDGVYGYSLGTTVSLLNPGLPEESYLVARLRGQMQGQPVLGTRMPLANQPPNVVDMLALMCFIQGLNPNASGYNLASGIDYQNCTYSLDPQALDVSGQGVTFDGGIAPMLGANCGGCHGSVNPPAGLDLVSPGLHDRLLLPSTERPGVLLIDPGIPNSSYLWLKVSGDASITGQKMPLTSAGTPGQLAPTDMQNLDTWILDGAMNN